MIPVPSARGPAAPVPDPVVARYRALFRHLDWSLVPERDPTRPWPGRAPHPPAAYIKALLVKLVEKHQYVTELRQFLVEHPALVRELGFRPVPAPTHPAGFDVERTVPGARWLRHQQRRLDHALLRRLLAATVATLRQHAPDLGETVAIDVTHCYAWVRENNPNQTLPGRYQATRQPRGDPDCTLGAKRRHPLPGRTVTEALWGYASGLASTTHPRLGDVVLAEVTQPVRGQDITVFAPLADQLQATLGQPPTNLTADAAFDAWSVYQVCAEQGGIAAIPRNHRGYHGDRDERGQPRCAQGHVMVPAHQGRHEDGYRVQYFRCPVRGDPTARCPHPRFASGGCTARINLELGGLQRVTLDRTSAAYQQIYRQRTTAERLFSQLKALGLERPRVRRGAAVARLLTLAYLLINLRALARVHDRLTSGQPPP